MSNQRMRITAKTTAALIAITATATSAVAQEIPIYNAGFEEYKLVNDDFSWKEIGGAPGWDIYDPDSLFLGVNVGDWNVHEDAHPGEAPEGLNVGWVYWGLVSNTAAGMQQILDDTLQADTAYELTVQVGNAQSYWSEFNQWDYDYEGFPGYRIELVAGDTVLAADDNSIVLDEGTFQLSTVNYDVKPGDPLIGEKLAIRLLNLTNDIGWEVEFDDVKLNASPIGGGLKLTIDSNCPNAGKATLTASGGSGGTIAFIYATGTGNVTIPNNLPCPGVTLGLNKTAKMAGTAKGNPAVFQGNAPAGACGRIYVQALDLKTCALSNVLLFD